MQRGIAIGIGSIGCAALQDLPDDPDLFQVFIGIIQRERLAELWPRDEEHQVYRHRIMAGHGGKDDGDDDPDFANLHLHSLLEDLQAQTPNAPILLVTALGNRCSEREAPSQCSSDGAIGSRLLRSLIYGRILREHQGHLLANISLFSPPLGREAEITHKLQESARFLHINVVPSTQEASPADLAFDRSLWIGQACDFVRLHRFFPKPRRSTR